MPLKRILVTACIVAFLSASAQAVPLFLGSAQLQPDNPADEEEYLELLLNGSVDVTLFANFENQSGSSFELNELCPDPLITFVVLKWGGAGGGTQEFWEIASNEPLPVIFTQPPGLGGLSHVRIFCPFDVPVPDSGATLGLLGGAVAVLAGVRRRLS